MDDMPPPPRQPRPRRSFAFVWWTAGTVLVFALAGLVASTIFQGATVTVHPKTEPVVLPSSITAVPNAQGTALGYQTMSVTQTASTSAPATGSQKVSKPAAGMITVYNAYNTDKQPLVANTRFEAPDGKIYRIKEAITVPGGTKKSDGTITPGTVTATVYADVAGAEYNRTESTRFTIPGFKTDPRYSKFYAESQGPITGGFVGDEPAVSQDTITKAGAALKQQLDEALRAATVSNIPAGFISVEGSMAVSYTALTQAAGPNGTAVLGQSATASSVIVRASDLAAEIAKQMVPIYNGESIAFEDAAQVRITLDPANKETTGPLTLNLSGSPKLVWQFDQNAVREALLGKDKSAFETIILNTFKPAIASAEANIRPFWKATFPTSADQIIIKVAN